MKIGLLVAITLSLIILAYPAYSMSQTATDDTDTTGIPGEIIPEDNSTGPVTNAVAEYKFDAGFYQKIQDLMVEVPPDGDVGVYDGERYYNTTIVVTRDDGDDRDPDEVAKENKDAIVKRLELIGARNIVAAESLSFVTASIPVADVPGFSLHDEVYRLGDGEILLIPQVDTARQTIHATPAEIRESVGRNLDGAGIIVGVIDRGIFHDSAFRDRVLARVDCDTNGCREAYLTAFSFHGIQVAQVIAASGLPAHNGIAPAAQLLDIRTMTSSHLAHGLDYALVNGADVVNMSFDYDFELTSNHCTANIFISSHSLIINEAVDKGMIVVGVSGNHGLHENNAVYRSITSPSCGNNVITVGGINDRSPNEITMYEDSGRGPTAGTPILKPELVAPATDIQVLQLPISHITSGVSGTSFAAPQVSSAAALLLQAKPDLTPVEIKAALLLGADWQGPIPCTSSQYELDDSTDNCSHKRQPADRNTANNAESLKILNNVGFGILNVSKTLEYVNSRTTTHNHVIGDYLDTPTSNKQYAFTVTDTSKPVKVILTWFVHPHGSITDHTNSLKDTNVANLGFTITQPRSTGTISALSAHQTNEFAVFNPPVPGTYIITVSGSGLGTIGKPIQNFALASTHSLSSFPPPAPENNPPEAHAKTIIIKPPYPAPIEPKPVIVRLFGSDPENDPVTFSVTDDPDHGTVSTTELITKTTSRLIYTPATTFTTRDTFTVTPQDGFQTGTPVIITIEAESLPRGSNNALLDTSTVRDLDIFEVTAGFDQVEYNHTFEGKDYAVSTIYVGSLNMEGVDLKFTTIDGHEHTVAFPTSGNRTIEFSSPVTIRSATLSADGIKEQAANENLNSRGTTPPNDVRMFVGYVPSSCSGASGTTDSLTCPVNPSHNPVTNPGLAIPDNTKSQDTSSTIHIPQNGTIVSISAFVDITHTFIMDLKVVLTTPNGTDITLHDMTGGGADNIQKTYDSSSHAGLETLKGFDVMGDWTLSVGDYEGGDTGTLNGWRLGIEYSLPTPPAPPAPTPAATFTSHLNDGRDRITVILDQKTSVDFATGDFTLSHGTISSVRNFDNSMIRYLQVTGVPYDTAVTVTYTGATKSLSDGGGELRPGTSSVTNVVSRPGTPPPVPPPAPMTPITMFMDDFQGDLSSWTLSGDSDWELGNPLKKVHQFDRPTNKVLTSSDCDTKCIAQITSPLDTSGPLSIQFDRFVDGAVDPGEGLYVEYSTDGDTDWMTLESYTHNNNRDNEKWMEESLTLDITSDSAHIRFLAKSSTGSEYVEIDNLVIMPVPPPPPDTTPPVFGSAPDVRRTATGSSTAVFYSTPAATDNVDSSVDVTCVPSSGMVFRIGTTEVTCTATDDAGNRATITFDVIVTRTGGGNPPPPPPPIDTAPTINSIHGVFIHYGDRASRTVTASDAQNDPIRLSISGNPGFVTLTDNGDGSGTITVSPTLSSHVGTYTVTVTATANGKTATTTFDVVIRADTAPTINTIDDVAIPYGTSTTKTITASDAQNDPITLTISGNPSFVTLTNNVAGRGTISINPTIPSHVGTYTVTVTATANGKTASTTFDVMVDHPRVALSDLTIEQYGESFLLRWAYPDNANRCAVDFRGAGGDDYTRIASDIKSGGYIHRADFAAGSYEYQVICFEGDGTQRTRHTATHTTSFDPDNAAEPQLSNLEASQNGSFLITWAYPQDANRCIVSHKGPGDAGYTKIATNVMTGQYRHTADFAEGNHEYQVKCPAGEGSQRTERVATKTVQFRGDVVHRTDEIHNLEITQHGGSFLLSWDVPEVSDWCTIHHLSPAGLKRVAWHITETNTFNHTADFAEGNHQYTITCAQDGNQNLISPPPRTVSFDADAAVPPATHLSNLAITEYTNFVLTWDYPQDAARCAVEHKGPGKAGYSKIATDVMTGKYRHTSDFVKGSHGYQVTCYEKIENGRISYSDSQTLFFGTPFEAINDTFEDLDSWNDYLRPTSTPTQNYTYVTSVTAATGNPAPSAHISGDGASIHYGIERKIDLSNLHEGQRLYIGFDYRATSSEASYYSPHAELILLGGGGYQIHSEDLFRGGTTDSGWRSFERDYTGIVGENGSITVRLFMADFTLENLDQNVYFDNFYVGTAPQAASSGAGG